MPYDPSHHRPFDCAPGRRSIRLPGYDYTRAGAYFVTLVAQDRECLFGQVVTGEMVLSRYGLVAEDYWQAIPRHFPRAQLDEYVIMPNHIHGIIWLVDDESPSSPDSPRRGEAFPLELPAGDTSTLPVPFPGVESRRGNASPLQNPRQPHGVVPGSLGAMVGNFKSTAGRRINRMRRTPGARNWQRNYYERIGRSEQALARIRTYIIDNPRRWDEDPENPAFRP